MPVRASRYYNNPQVGAALENIASLFAPPSGSDAAGYATAGAKRAEAERLAALFDYTSTPGFDQTQFDRMGQATGQWTPAQGYYGVDTNATTARRGQDVSAATSLANNRADNQRSVVTSLYGPLNQGQVRPALPSGISDLYGLPGVPAEQGLPPDLSETELKAQILADLPIEQQQAAVLSDIPIEQIIGDSGAPEYARRSDAVGREPFVNKGAEAKPTFGSANIGGLVVSVKAGTDGIWRNSQTGDPIPPDVQVFDLSRPTGTNEDVGLGKPATSMVEKQLIDTAVAKNTAKKLRDLIASAPASQGAVGWLRGTAQNVIQTGGELGAYFGGKTQEIQQEIASGLHEANLAGAFDPNIPAIEMMANLLAFQYAKLTTGERLSNEMLRNSRQALGLGNVMANQADAITRLDTAISLIGDQEAILRDALGRGVREPGSDSTNQQTRPRATNPDTGEVIEWDGRAWVPVQ